MWSQMSGLEAEWDLASIEKVDVRKKLRRFTVLLALEANVPKFCSYNLLFKPLYDPEKVWSAGPAVSICHAPVTHLSRTYG